MPLKKIKPATHSDPKELIAQERKRLNPEGTKKPRVQRTVDFVYGNCYPTALRDYRNQEVNYLTPKTLEAGLTTLDKSLRLLWEATELMEAMARNVHKQLGWKSRKQVAKSLRLLLGTASYWLQFRQDFLTVQGLMNRVIHKSSQSLTTNRDSAARPRCRKPDDAHATEFTVSTPKELELKKLVQLKNSWNLLCQVSRDLYDQCEAWSVVPGYMELKELLPCFGKEALSALIACKHGDVDKLRASQDSVFGWKIGCAHDDKATLSANSDVAHKVTCYLRQLIRCITDRLPQQHVMIEASKDAKGDELQGVERGRARVPSLDWGLTILSKGMDGASRALPSFDRVPTIAERVARMRGRYHWAVSRQLLCRSTQVPSNIVPSFVHRCLKEPYKKRQIWMRMVGKIAHARNFTGPITDQGMPCYGEQPSEVSSGNPPATPLPEWANSVHTFLLGPPEFVQGDDYMAPALWVHSDGVDAQHRGAKMQYMQMQQGYILLRRNWNDCFHRPGLTPPNAAEVSAQLDLSTGHLRRGPNADPDAKLTTDQRKAKILWQCRSIAGMTRQDSYGVGNCIPGTEEFIRRLASLDENKKYGWNPDTNLVDGRMIAKMWRNAGFHQLDLFGKVVRAMHKKMTELRLMEEQRYEELMIAQAEAEGMVANKYRILYDPRYHSAFNQELYVMRTQADLVAA